MSPPKKYTARKKNTTANQKNEVLDMSESFEMHEYFTSREVLSPYERFDMLCPKTLSDFCQEIKLKLTTMLHTHLSDLSPRSLENEKNRILVIQTLQVLIENEGIHFLMNSIRSPQILKILFDQVYPGEEGQQVEAASDRQPVTATFHRKRITKRFIEYGLLESCEIFPLTLHMLQFLITQFIEDPKLCNELELELEQLEGDPQKEDKEQRADLELLLCQILNATGMKAILHCSAKPLLLVRMAEEMEIHLTNLQRKSKPIVISQVSGAIYF